VQDLAAAARQQASTAVQPLRVLVVDDNQDLVLSLRTLLRTEHHDSRGLYKADDILEHVRDYNPHVVIMDLAMPGKSGWEAAKEIRACVPGKRLVLVALSGEHTRGADRDASRMNGFDFHLMKPCDPHVLLTLLHWVRIDSPYRTRL
jgi:DNA-binding response OmpR family regulator